MSLVDVKKLCRIVQPYQTITLSHSSIYGSTISVPPEIAWLRTYNTYCNTILFGNSNKLLYKNMGMILSRLTYHGYTNGIKRYRKVRMFR